MADKNYTREDEIFIDKLQEEINDINKNIRSMMNRRDSLVSIIHAKKEKIVKNVSKKRIFSSKRVEITISIKDFIYVSDKQVKCSDIYKHLRSFGIVINESTVRTYLSYMKEDGVIKEGSKKGYWIKSQ